MFDAFATFVAVSAANQIAFSSASLSVQYFLVPKSLDSRLLFLLCACPAEPQAFS